MNPLEDERNDLAKQNQDLATVISNLRQENESLKADNDSLKIEKNSMLNEIKRLEAKLNEFENIKGETCENSIRSNLQFKLPQGSDFCNEKEKWSISGNAELFEENTEIDRIFSLIGQYQSGKTFLLSKISEIPLNYGRKFPTTSLNFQEIEISGINYVSIDTPGYFKPCEFENFSYENRKLQDMFCKNFVIRMSKIIIYVVNNFTISEQKFLHKISESLNFMNKTFIIVHNFKDICVQDELFLAWKEQILDLYQEKGSEKKFKKTIETIIEGRAEKKVIFYYDKNNFQHVCLMNNNCKAGFEYNLSSLIHIRNIMEYKSRQSPKSLISRVSNKLKLLINNRIELSSDPDRGSWNIELNQTSSEILAEEIKFRNYFWFINSHQKLRDPSLFMDENCFRISFDMPGALMDDLSILCSNEFTQITSKRNFNGHQVSVKAKKRYNEVCIRFKVPKRFHHMDPSYRFKDGVLELEYNLQKPRFINFNREETLSTLCSLVESEN